MSEPAVLYDVADQIATITLNRPENRNSMTPEVLDGLANAVSQLRADADVRCVIVTGRGKSFCAGADFKSRANEPKQGDPFVAPQDRFYATYAPFLSMLDIDVPTIAAMQGHAIGGGLGLGIVCDMRVANREARYGANFVRLGLHPGMATTYLLPRLMGVPRAVEFLLTGRIVSGAEAAEAGLVNYAVEADRFSVVHRSLPARLRLPLRSRCAGPNTRSTKAWAGIRAVRRGARPTCSHERPKPMTPARVSPPCSAAGNRSSREADARRFLSPQADMLRDVVLDHVVNLP